MKNFFINEIGIINEFSFNFFQTFSNIFIQNGFNIIQHDFPLYRTQVEFIAFNFIHQ